MKTIREIAQECAEEFDPEYKGTDGDILGETDGYKSMLAAAKEK